MDLRRYPVSGGQDRGGHRSKQRTGLGDRPCARGKRSARCRGFAKRGEGRAARDQIVAGLPAASVEVTELDLASLESVRRFAAGYVGEHDKLDLLINNAGVMAIPRVESRRTTASRCSSAPITSGTSR